MEFPLYKPRPERWPQFTLRGLFFATTLAALLAPWAIAQYREWAELQRLLDFTEPLIGGSVQFNRPRYTH